MTMVSTLRRWRDGAGRGLGRAAGAALAAALLAAPATAGPGDYKARRFDVAARAVDGGALEVEETILLEFQTGTFTKVWREIPTSRTDGIDILDARMDGEVMARGDGPGQVSVSEGSRVRVEWHFAETAPGVHTFQLHYLARGVAYRDGAADVIRWRALPSAHDYRIDASRVVIEAGAAPIGTGGLEQHRVDSASAVPTNRGVVIEAAGIRSGGWVIGEVRYPAGTVARAAPAWRRHDEAARALAPTWLIGAATVLAMGLMLIFVMRAGYAAPSIAADDTTTTEPPQSLPAALAAVLVGKGRAFGYSPVATLLDLADRGALVVRELPKRLGRRSYQIETVPGQRDLAAHESEAILIAFGDRGDQAVALSKAQSRLARSSKRFNAAVSADLARRGLLDGERKAARDRLMRGSVAMLIGGAPGAGAAALFVPRFEGWPFLLPLALELAGLVGVIAAATMTPLSDQGLIEAARWRGFKRHLKTLVSSDDPHGAALPSRWIVYGVAVGLAPYWERYLKRHPETAPAWFQSASGDTAAFATFVGSHAASSSGAGASGGASAGGGGSGAG